MKKAFFLIVIVFINMIASAQWMAQSTGTGSGFKKIYFPDSNTGYAIDGNGGVVKTVNGGMNWTYSYPGHSGQFAIFFSDTATGYIAGGNGLILKTINGGANWTVQTSGVSQTLRSIYFLDANIGYMVGDGNTIIKTINGGLNWALQTTFNNYYLCSVYFTDVNIGYVVGYEITSGTSPIIFKTINGGINWTSQTITIATPGVLSSVFFPTANIGYASGGSAMLKTTDAGINWMPLTDPFFLTSGCKALYFVSADTGYATCGTAYAGKVIKTTDGGINWYLQNTGFTASSLLDIFFTDANKGYAVSDLTSYIYQTINGGVGIEENEFENGISVYPNPTSGILNINTEGIRIKEIRILNVLGEEIKRLDNSVDIDLTNIDRGIYFVEVKTEKGIVNKKIILQ